MIPCMRSTLLVFPNKQGRPVNVKHDARCVMGKIGGEDERPKKGGFSFIVIKVLYYITVV